MPNDFLGGLRKEKLKEAVEKGVKKVKKKWGARKEHISPFGYRTKGLLGKPMPLRKKYKRKKPKKRKIKKIIIYK